MKRFGRQLFEWLLLLAALLAAGGYESWRKMFPAAQGLFGVFALTAALLLFFYQRRRLRFERLAQSQVHALQSSEARLRSIFDSAPDALLVSDEKGLITMANHQVENLLGYRVDELLGRSIEILVPTRGRAQHPAQRSGFAALPSARRMGYGLAVQALRKDGSECDVEISLSRIQTDEGLLFSCGLRDISERIRSREQLRIDAVAFESNQAMVITDANNQILRINQAFADMTGYTSQDVVGRTPRIFKSGRHDADFYRAMWDSIKRTGGWTGEIWDRRKDGEIYPKWLTISAVKDGAGKVTHYVGSHFDISERKLAEEMINTLAFFDQLTGLPNRTLLTDRLKQAQAASVRSGNFSALLFIDLDNFKTLNDTLGHDMGDLLLKQVAQRLTQCGREGDTVARLGGDEFVVVLLGLSADQTEAANAIEMVAEKLLTALRQSYLLGELTHRSTASIGATVFRGQQVTIDELMKQADLAMYKAKDAGRNALRFFDPSMELAVKKRVALEDDLRQAMETDQFTLHYQAQVTHEGHVTGAEVLVRWQHPEHGLVSPAEFIPLAEDTGLILPLGHWVLKTACTQLALWAQQAEMAHLTVAVNVSAYQFNHADFVLQVLAVIKATGANPEHLKLELTESLLVGNVQEIIQKMQTLRAEGLRFSLDDFGTGYSSLSYLKRLPLDQLKIDKSFVRDVLTDPNDAAIAQTVVALGKSLGLNVIAEGVETEEQRDFLATSGCHAYQGYFYGRPVPVGDFERFVQQMELAAEHG